MGSRIAEAKGRSISRQTHALMPTLIWISPSYDSEGSKAICPAA